MQYILRSSLRLTGLVSRKSYSLCASLRVKAGIIRISSAAVERIESLTLSESKAKNSDIVVIKQMSISNKYI